MIAKPCTLEEDRELLRLWGKMSSRQIGKVLGGRNKNSVISRYHKLRGDPLAKPKPQTVPLTVKAVDISGSLKLPLSQLSGRACVFPVNDAPDAGGHLFCGLPTDKRYCQGHMDVAYRVKPRATEAYFRSDQNS